MLLFYAPNISGEIYEMPEDESKHLIKVLRKSEGDEVVLTDGCGNFYYCVIQLAHPKHCELKVERNEVVKTNHGHYLHLAVAPTKNISRYEWFLEKACEIGVDEITPIICDNSERKVVKIDRLNKILIAAMKQSLKANLPILNDAVKLKDFLKAEYSGQRFIAYCNDEHRKVFKEEINKGSDICVLIGPEGDFSNDEVGLALQSDYKPISLGNSRLRTETAAVVACHTAVLINE